MNTNKGSTVRDFSGSREGCIAFARLKFAPDATIVARQQAGTAARCLEFLILTSTRTSEAIEAPAGEFDLVAKTSTRSRANVAKASSSRHSCRP